MRKPVRSGSRICDERHEAGANRRAGEEGKRVVGERLLDGKISEGVRGKAEKQSKKSVEWKKNSVGCKKCCHVFILGK